VQPPVLTNICLGTTQVCLFRDSYTPLTATGFSIFGLSGDSPKANTTFKEKQKLPYALLCDPSRSLISAIGLKKGPNGTQRGVFVIDKAGKVLAAEPGGPAATVEVVKKLIESSGPAPAAVTAEPVVESEKAADEIKPANGVANGTANDAEATSEDVAKAEVAADVADTAEKLDSKEA
jgi:peroxiredoxin Q/BCP